MGYEIHNVYITYLKFAHHILNIHKYTTYICIHYTFGMGVRINVHFRHVSFLEIPTDVPLVLRVRLVVLALGRPASTW